MQVGEIVRYAEQSWRVYKMDRQVRTAILVKWDGTREEIADDDPGAVVVCNPSTAWPFTTSPRRSERAGRIVKLTRATNPPRELVPYVDWAPSDQYRAGGSIFLNPRLGFRIGEVLSAEHQNGSLSRITITQAFGTMAQRQLRAMKPKLPVRAGRFNSLMDDGMDDD
jgi:hypothetical protein